MPIAGNPENIGQANNLIVCIIFYYKSNLTKMSFLLPSSASLGFLSDYLPEDRKALAIYPIVLFYFGISCLILTQNTPFI